MMKFFFTILSSLVFSFDVQKVYACSVCFSATKENQLAFIETTIFLTFVPLIAIGTFVFWMWRRLQKRDQNHG